MCLQVNALVVVRMVATRTATVSVSARDLLSAGAVALMVALMVELMEEPMEEMVRLHGKQKEV